MNPHVSFFQQLQHPPRQRAIDGVMQLYASSNADEFLEKETPFWDG